MLHGSACCAQKIETTRLSFILTVKVTISHFHLNLQTLFAAWFGDPANNVQTEQSVHTLVQPEEMK